MSGNRPPREAGEDYVAWRNRCLRAQGRHDVRWRYKPGGGTELVDVGTPRSKLEERLL
jgi:hypothetical protein